jgi:hypothetical protein
MITKFIKTVAAQVVKTEPTQPTHTVQGRWGWYPCDYDTYRKIRKLYGYYLKSLRMDAAHARWARKEPQNRVLKRKVLDAQGRVCKRETVLGEDGQPVMRPEPPIMRVPISHFVEEDYRNAKMPKATQADVQPLKLSLSSIDQQLKACEEM